MPLSGHSQGRLTASLIRLTASQGLRLSASQDVPTHWRQARKDTHSWVETPAVATDTPVHSCAMLPGMCNTTDSGEHSMHLTTLFLPVLF